MRIKVALLTGMMKRITDTINLDRVKEASSSPSHIYSQWVWKSPQAAARAQQPELASVTRWLIGHYPATSHYDRLRFILCRYIKFTVMMILPSKWRAAPSYFPFDIKNSPGYCYIYFLILFSSLCYRFCRLQPNFLPALQPICLLLLSPNPPAALPHRQRNQMLLLRLNSSKASVYSSPFLHLALMLSHSFLAAAQFYQPEFLSSTFGSDSPSLGIPKQ